MGANFSQTAIGGLEWPRQALRLTGHSGIGSGLVVRNRVERSDRLGHWDAVPARMAGAFVQRRPLANMRCITAQTSCAWPTTSQVWKRWLPEAKVRGPAPAEDLLTLGDWREPKRQRVK